MSLSGSETTLKIFGKSITLIHQDDHYKTKPEYSSIVSLKKKWRSKVFLPTQCYLMKHRLMSKQNQEERIFITYWLSLSPVPYLIITKILPYSVYSALVCSARTWCASSHIFIFHYSDVIMSAMVYQITGVSIVYSTVCSGADQRNIKLRVTGLCERNLPVTGECPAQKASNAENDSIWWRHHA